MTEARHGRARGHRCRAIPRPHTAFLLADGIYENEYVREDGRCKIRGITVTMTYYVALERARIWFHSAPPSEAMRPDAPSQPVVEALGRQFSLALSRSGRRLRDIYPDLRGKDFADQLSHDRAARTGALNLRAPPSRYATATPVRGDAPHPLKNSAASVGTKTIANPSMAGRLLPRE
jgi:hypothetical protein